MAADEKKKSLAALIIAGAPKPGGASGGPGMDEESGEGKDADDDGDQGLQSAADEIISAIEQKDSGALVEALKSFMAMC